MTAAFVTGGGGFVGAALVRALCRRGDAVRALVRRAGPPPDAGAVTRVAGDLRDPASYRDALDGVDVVFHCGALLAPVPDAALADEVNHRATLRLADEAARAGVPVLVFVSSIAAVGFDPRAGLVKPDARCAPTTPYGRSKRDAEAGLLRRDAGMRIAVVRPPTVYGPGERRNFLALARAVATGTMVVPGRGDNRMSFCHVDNLVDGLTWAAEEPRARGVLHVSDATPVTLREAVGEIGRALGRPPLPLPLPMPVAWVAAVTCELAFGAAGRPAPLGRARLSTITADCALDVSATSALGFDPRVPFARGVEQTIDDYRDHGLLP